ncbi:MAG: transketolase family protein [Clostridia bacterium]|nr:transketolase family protein [Clostridia bacterium]
MSKIHLVPTGEKEATRVAYGKALVELGKENDKVVVLDADLAAATMTGTFKKEFPERFYDCGIAEANMVDMAAGMSTMGLIPFCSTFAVFAGRSYDQIRNGVCYPKFNVKFGFSHAGITLGEDGGSHQAIEDLALMRVLPGMTIFSPSDANETRQCVKAAAEINGPVFIRTARLPSPVDEARPFTVGKGEVLKEGKDCVIFTCGIMLEHCVDAVNILEEKGVDAALVSFATIKPFDKELALEWTNRTGHVFTIEEHSVIGGLGDAVADAICGKGAFTFRKIGINDEFGQSGKPADLLKEYGLTGAQLAEKILADLK